MIGLNGIGWSPIEVRFTPNICKYSIFEQKFVKTMFLAQKLVNASLFVYGQGHQGHQGHQGGH